MKPQFQPASFLTYLLVTTALMVSAFGCALPTEICDQVPEAAGVPSALCPPPPDVVNEVAPGWIMDRPFPEIETLHDVVVLDVGNVYAVGTAGSILHLVDDEWVQEDSGTEVTLRAVSGRSDDNGDYLLAVGDEGTVLRRESEVWSAVPNITFDGILFDVWVNNRIDAFAVGDDGKFMRVNDLEVVSMDAEAEQTRFVRGNACNPGNNNCPMGTVCQPADAADPMSPTVCFNPNDPTGMGLIEETYLRREPIKGVSGTGDDRVFAIGPRGLVMRFDGMAWTCERSGTARTLTSVFTRGSNVWATAQDGVLLRRTDEFMGDPTNCNDPDTPINWESADYRLPVPLFLRDVWMSGGNDIFVVGLAGSIYHRTGGEWVDTSLAEDVHLRAIDGIVTQFPDDELELLLERDVYVVGAGGRIVRGPSIVADADKEDPEAAAP